MSVTTTCPACERGYRCANCGDCPEHCKCECEQCEGLGHVHVLVLPTVYGDTKQMDCGRCYGTGRGFQGAEIPGLTARDWARPNLMIEICRSSVLWSKGPIVSGKATGGVELFKAMGESYEAYVVTQVDAEPSVIPKLLGAWFQPYTDELPEEAYDPNDFRDQGGIGFEPR